MGKRRTSRMWDFFIPINDQVACCKLCNRNASYKSSISNLKRHLERKHPTAWLSSSRTGSSSQVAAIFTETTKTEDIQQTPNSSTSRRRSILWNYFVSKNDYVAICSVCNNDIRYKASTANLKRHLERKHQDVFNAVFCGESSSANNQEQSNITTTDTSPLNSKADKNSISPNTTFKTNKVYYVPKIINGGVNSEINNSLLKLFTHDYQPIGIIESDGFKELVKALNPAYTLPKKGLIVDTLLPSLYEETYVNAQEIVRNARLITATIDCWTSVDTENYMTVTVHFITEDFESKSVLVGCTLLDTDYNSSNIVSELKRIVEEWNLEDKVLLVISPNLDLNDINRVVREELHCEYFTCYIDTLNLIVQNELKAIDPLLTKLRCLISDFKHDVAASAQLAAIQAQLGREPEKLTQNDTLSWISSLYMIRKLLLLEEALSLLEIKLSGLTLDEWRLLKDVKKVLEPMESLVKIMSEQKYVSASSIIILTKGLENVYKEMKKRTMVSLAESIVSGLLNGIQNHLGDLEDNNTLLTCTFLDPRFKNVGFSSDAVANKAQKLVEELVCNKMDVMNLFSSTEEIEIEINTDEDGEKNLLVRNNGEEFSVWGHFDEKAAAVQFVATASSRAVEEVQRYVNDALLDKKGDPLLWWKQNSCKYTYLKEVAVERLGTTATSVPCEHIFTEKGKILADRRAQLDSDLIKQLVFINANKT